MGVGMPGCLLLQQFGEHVFRAFGHVAYHVGSSLTEKKGWRDVDVRLMLPDDEYERMGLGDPERPHDNKRWVSQVVAWCSFGKSLTGLPIDFQIQQRTHANKLHPGPRGALFLVCDLRPYDEKDKLIAECRAFIERNQIRCPESICQVDRIMEAAPELIEKICGTLGYYKDYEDD